MGRKQDRIEPLCRVVRFEATDGVELSGLLYEPQRRSKRAAIFLHGNGGASVFESKRTNLLASSFIDAGVAWFAFNNRGAHLIKRLRRRRGTTSKGVSGGMAHELIRECVFDIDGAIRELRSRGYSEFTLVGHSTGANKVAVYDARKQRNPVKRYVLLAGGDDTGILWQQLGTRRFSAALARAKERIRERRGDELVPASVSSLPMSWRSFHDMANPDGDYNVFPFLEVMKDVRLGRRTHFRHLRGIRKPTLILYGDSDEYCYGDVSRCVAILADALGPKENIEMAILADADHGFSGREEELAEVMLGWMEA